MMREDLPMSSSRRDLRLDLFRGLANWAIFLDHIPNNAVAWLTTRNYGFSDAADIFVFISGYTAAFVYARRMEVQGVLAGAALLLRRVWQLYVAHILLFVFYAAAIGFIAQRGHSHLLDEFNVKWLIEKPVETLTQGLALKFKPLNLDVLPLYIVLMACFPPLLAVMRRFPDPVLAGSAFLYLGARWFGWNLSAWPSGNWYFNPFAWQFLFVIGAWVAMGGGRRVKTVVLSVPVVAISAAYLAFAMAVTLAVRFDAVSILPQALIDLFDPNDKTNLAPYRILHLLALMIVLVRLVPKEWDVLRSDTLRPLVVCGQRSLEVFCVGIFLSFVGHFILEMWSGAFVTQIAVSVVGISLMTAVAFYRTWSRKLDAPTTAKHASTDTTERHADLRIKETAA
jgi:hypothetical protein